ncbi:hypothetical protein ACJX0J_038022, partial [Zea mays]
GALLQALKSSARKSIFAGGMFLFINNYMIGIYKEGSVCMRFYGLCFYIKGLSGEKFHICLARKKIKTQKLGGMD